MKKRVFVSSFGIVCPLGDSPEKILGRMDSGGAVREASPAANGGHSDIGVFSVKDFSVKAYTGRFKNARYLNRGAALSLAAAVLCIESARKQNPEDLSEAGLFVGAGPNLDLGLECPSITEGKMDTVLMKSLWILPFLPNTAASLISTHLGIHGENLTVGTACAASLQAIGEAFRKVRDGYLPAALAGGGDSRLGPGGLSAYRMAGALHENAAKPYAPFGKDREGFVPGEGGAFVWMEAMDAAERNKRKPVCEIVGFGASMDGHQMTAPHPEGFFGEKAVRAALDDAGIEASGVGLVLAHGTGTPLNDDMEAALIRRVFPHARVTALKSHIGHGASASGALELCLALCCMEKNTVPHIMNLSEPKEDRLHFVRKGGGPFPEYCVIQNFGFGGQNAAIVIRALI